MLSTICPFRIFRESAVTTVRFSLWKLAQVKEEEEEGGGGEEEEEEEKA